MGFRKRVTTTNMQNNKRDTDVKNRLLDYGGEGKGGTYERIALKHVCYHM